MKAAIPSSALGSRKAIALGRCKLMRACGLALCAALAPGMAQAASPQPAVLCHYTYGGEEHTLVTTPQRSPYEQSPVAVGSYFLLKVTFQTRPADVAGIRVYVYADREPVPVPIHQADFPYPPPTPVRPAYGFTGQHRVYEPVRDGELQYWCEINPRKQPASTAP